MRYRILGKTGLKVSEVGFGCGNVGGLMVRSDHKTRVRVAARAIDLGINYFDTARQYGAGKSETNLGSVLKELGADVLVGTKVRVAAEDMENIEDAIVKSVQGSLGRLGKDCVDLIQLHNSIGFHRQPDRGWLGVDDLEQVVTAFQSLQSQGKVRFWGITGLGETDALRQAVDSVELHTIQTCYNLINPSAGTKVSRDFPFQDYRQIIDLAAKNQMGVLAIRILAGGALSGTVDRHSVAAPPTSPIGSNVIYEEDVERSKIFRFLIREGQTSNLASAAIRFAISKAEISTALVGISSLEQVEQAVQAADSGPLSAEELRDLNEIW